MNTRLSIQLPHALDSFVRTKILAGRHTSVSEVVRDALRLMEDRDAVLAQYKNEVWHSIAEALGVLSEAPVMERETILDGVEAQLEKMEAVMRAATGGVDFPRRAVRNAPPTASPMQYDDGEEDDAAFSFTPIAGVTLENAAA